MFFVSQQTYQRVISILLILVCFVVPTAAQAWGPGPNGLPSEPKFLYLDEEKKFLDDFHAKKMEIISDPAWRETSKGSYILDLPKSKGPDGQIHPLKFVMTPQEKEFRFWNLYVQEQVGKEWSYKYKGSPLGYVENHESQEPRFITYINSKSLQTALDKLKISYQPTRPAAIETIQSIDPDQLAHQFPSATAALMCEDLLDENFSNKDQHKMIPAVFDTFSPEVASAVRNGKNYGTQKRVMEGSQNISSASLYGPSKNKSHYAALTSLYKKSREAALQTTLMAVVNFQHRFYGAQDSKTWVNTLLNVENVEEETASDPNYKRVITQKISDVLQQVPTFMTVDEKLKAIDQFNTLHRSIDASCAEANKSYRASSASQGTILHGEKPYNSTDRRIIQQNRENITARANLEAKYKKQFTPQIEAMINASDLRLLFGSKTFQEKVGTFDAEDCFKSGKSGLNQISLADVYLGMSESKKKLFEALDDRIEEYHVEVDEYMDVIQKYVASYPLMIKAINSQIKTLYGQDLDELRISCNAVNEVYQDEKMERFFDYGFMAVALIAGALTAGAGTVAVLSVMGAVAAIEATEAGLDWYRGYQLENNARKGLLTGNNTVVGAREVVSRAKSIQTQAKWDFALTIVSYGVGDVLGEAYKTSKNTIKTVAIDSRKPPGSPGVLKIEPVQPIQPKPVQEIPVNHQVSSSRNIERSDLKIAAGTGAGRTGKAIQELSQEFVDASDKIQKKFGSDYRLLNIEDGDGLVVNPKGELQNVYVHKEIIELESVVTKKTVGNMTWDVQNGVISKTAKLDDGIAVKILDQPKQIKITLQNGQTILTKVDGSMDEYISAFMLTTKDQAVHLSEGFIFRSGDRILLVKSDGTILKGDRIGAEVVFSNHAEEVYVGAYRHPIFAIESEKWGKPTQWQRVAWDGDSPDVSEFEVPTLKEDGLPSGYGDINCSGLSFSGDAWLSRKSPLSCALPDSHFRDIVGSHIDDVSQVAGKSPTVTPQNAAAYYHSKHEVFSDYTSVHDRLMKMEDGGTALVYVKDTNGYAHVHNARKEGNRVVYYDFQARTISTDPKAQFFNNRTNKIDVVETTDYHRVSEVVKPDIHPTPTNLTPDYVAQPSSLKAKVISPVTPSRQDRILGNTMDRRQKLIDQITDPEIKNTVLAWDEYELKTSAFEDQLNKLGYTKTTEFIRLHSSILDLNNQIVDLAKKKLTAAGITFTERSAQNGARSLEFTLPKNHSWMRYIDQKFPKSDKPVTFILNPRKSSGGGLSYLRERTYGVNQASIEKIIEDDLIAELFSMEIAETAKMPLISELKWIKGKISSQQLDDFYKKQLKLSDYNLNTFNQRPDVEKFYRIVNSMPEMDRKELIDILNSFSKYQLCLTIDGVFRIADDYTAIGYMYLLKHQKMFFQSRAALESTKHLKEAFDTLTPVDLGEFKKLPFFKERNIEGQMFIEPDDLDFAADELYKLMTTGDNLLPGIENASRYFYSIEEIRITEQSGVYQVLARHLDEVGVLIKMTRQGDQFVFERMGSVL